MDIEKETPREPIDFKLNKPLQIGEYFIPMQYVRDAIQRAIVHIPENPDRERIPAIIIDRVRGMAERVKAAKIKNHPLLNPNTVEETARRCSFGTLVSNDALRLLRDDFRLSQETTQCLRDLHDIWFDTMHVEAQARGGHLRLSEYGKGILADYQYFINRLNCFVQNNFDDDMNRFMPTIPDAQA